jgi:hypothetical protein
MNDRRRMRICKSTIRYTLIAALGLLLLKQQIERLRIAGAGG